MGLYKFLFFLIFIGGFSLVLIFLTFSGNKYKDNDIISFSTGSFEYINNKFIQNNSNSFSKEKIYKNNISYLNEIYFKGDNFDINGNKITLKNGLYIFNIEDISKNYEINFANYKLSFKSPGEFIIDNRIKTSIKFIDINSVIKLDVIKEGKILNSLSVFPHVYMFLNPKIDVYKYDLFKLEKVYRIGYIKNKILDLNKNLDLSFLKTIYKSNNLDDIFQVYFSSYINKKMISELSIQKIDYSINSSDSLIEKQIKEKGELKFLNKDKEAYYYKKKIISGVISLLNSKKEDLENIYNSEIKINIDKLKSIENVNFDDINKILTSYYYNILSLDNIDYLEYSFILSKIINDINSFQNNKLLISYFTSNKIVKLNDLGIKEDKYFFEKYIFFLKNYFKENNIIFNDEDKTIDIKKSKFNPELEYIRQYTKNMLIYGLNFDNNNLRYNLEILNWYLQIENLIDQDNTKTYSYIIENYNIFQKINNEILYKNFEEQRNERGLLIVKNNGLDLVNLEKLNILYNKYNNYVKKNEEYIDSKNKNYIQDYDNLYKQFLEYYEALRNYSNYIIKYDKFKNDLLSSKSLNTNVDIIVSKEELNKYLSNFNSLDLSSAETSIVDNDYYIVKNVFINGDNYSFNLYPKDKNRIKNFTKNGENIEGEYILDDIKKIYDEKISEVEESEMYKYDFKNFFINMFYPKKEEKKQEKKEEKVYVKETNDVIILKNDKLIGGDFKLIKNIVDIKYQDITANFNTNTNKFDIKVNNSKINLNLTFPDGEQKNYVGEFSGEYVFDSQNHYFKKIKIKFLDLDSSDGENIVYLFGGKEFTYYPKIDIKNFEEIIKQKVLDFINKNL